MDIETFKPLSEGIGFHTEEEEQDTLQKKSFKKELEKHKTLEKELEVYLPKNKAQSPQKLKFPPSPTKITKQEQKTSFHQSFSQVSSQSKEQEKKEEKKAHTEASSQTENFLVFENFPLLSFLYDIAFVAMMFSAFILSTALGLGSEALHSLFTKTPTLHFVFMFVVFFQIYALFSRCYFGMTLGEAQSFLSLGTRKQKSSSFFLPLVLWRTLLNIGTGLIFFPVLSLFFRKDLLGNLSGLFLYEQK